MFSREILAMIFKNFDDPIELMRLQQVSRTWRDMIQKILSQYKDKWRSICKKNVPLFWIGSSLKNMGYNISLKCCYETDLYPDFWKDIYISWRKWQLKMILPRPINAPNRALKFAGTERITCIDIMVDIVAIGSTEGLIYFCPMKDLGRPFFIAFHGQPVTEIQFWGNRNYRKMVNCMDTSSLGLAVSNCANGILKYWDFEKREEVKSGGYLGQIIQTGWNWAYASLSVWKGIVRSYTLTSSSVKQQWEFELPLIANEEVVAIGQGNTNTISILTFDRERTRQYIMNDGMHPRLDSRYNLSRYTKLLPKTLASIKEKKFYCHFDKMAICLAGHMLAFSIDQYPWIVYNMLDQVGSKVTCVLLSMNRVGLIIGLESGAVHAYEVNSYRDWMNFDFKTCTRKTAMFNSGPIMFRSNEGSKNDLKVIAATTTNLRIVNIEFNTLTVN